MSTAPYEDLFSNVVSDIKTYRGDDPLRPWLRGIRTLRQSLPRQTLSEKLPRFLQKCAEAFESDRRYCNDTRYLRVWIHLMDHVDDPRGVLRRMEENQIGVKHAAFYVAYALYYEKQKKFEKAERMYHVGVQNLAEPAAELQKSYEQFLCRTKLHKKRISKLMEAKANATSKGLPVQQKKINVHKVHNSAGLRKVEQIQSDGQMAKTTGTCQPSPLNVDNKHPDYMNMMGQQVSLAHKTCENSTKSTNASRGESILKNCPPSVQRKGEVTVCSGEVLGGDCVSNSVVRITGDKTYFEDRGEISEDLAKHNSLSSDDTVVVKFVDSAFVGKSEAEDACHHGLVDPTINMKEAINDINGMFREPLDPNPKLERKSKQNRTRETPLNSSGFEVYVDEDVDEGLGFVNKGMENTGHYTAEAALSTRHSLIDKSKPFVGTFKILADDDNECDDADETEINNMVENSKLPDYHVDDFDALVHPKVDNLPLGNCDGLDVVNSEYVKLKEDTFMCNFVGSTVFGENVVENACHHGLVDPTINLKEAMDDINSMFGKPIDFIKTSKLRKRGYLPEQKEFHEFSILVDEDLDQPTGQTSLSCSAASCRESDLFEPTVFTKEAMDEINKMFGKSLDF